MHYGNDPFDTISYKVLIVIEILIIIYFSIEGYMVLKHSTYFMKKMENNLDTSISEKIEKARHLLYIISWAWLFFVIEKIQFTVFFFLSMKYRSMTFFHLAFIPAVISLLHIIIDSIIIKHLGVRSKRGLTNMSNDYDNNQLRYPNKIEETNPSSSLSKSTPVSLEKV
jgi:hypothetical protein